jgi:hypothetical protein
MCVQVYETHFQNELGELGTFMNTTPSLFSLDTALDHSIRTVDLTNLVAGIVLQDNPAQHPPLFSIQERQREWNSLQTLGAEKAVGAAVTSVRNGCWAMLGRARTASGAASESKVRTSMVSS